MDPLVSAFLLILVALLGARFSFSTLHVPPGPRLVFSMGTHFLFLGVVLGSQLLGLLSLEVVERLYPLLALGLGWIGLLFGIQLDRESLSHFPARFYQVAFGQAILTFLVVAVVGIGLMRAFGLGSDATSLLVIGAAAIASLSSPAGIGLISSNFLIRGNLRELLFFVASLDGVVGIVALQIGYSWYHPDWTVMGQEPISAPVWMLIAVVLGIVGGIVFVWLSRPRPSPEELVLFLLGMGAFASGAALHLGVSPLFVCAVMGAVIANLGDSQRVYRALERWEKPVYVVFLVVAGASLTFPTPWILPLAVAFAVLRAAGKVGAGYAAGRAVRLHFQPPKGMGLALLAQGGMAVAMVGDFVLTRPNLEVGGMNGTELLFGAVVIAIVLSELTAPFLTTSVLRRAGEISPEVEEALAAGDTDKARQAAVDHDPPVSSVNGSE